MDVVNRAAGLVALFLALSACGAARPASQQPPPRSAVPTNVDRIRQIIETRQRLGQDAGEYALAPGDLVAVTIYHYSQTGGNFTTDVRVDDLGFISLPMVGSLPAAGLTVGQLRAALVEALRRADVMHEPMLGVFVKDYQGRRVIVLGAVARPGGHTLSGADQTLADVLSMAGGLTNEAGNYVLFRPAGSTRRNDPQQDTAASWAVRPAAEQVREGTDVVVLQMDDPTGEVNAALLTLPVVGGDLFIVPRAGTAFIDGEVEKPGAYPLVRGMTLTALLANAGGLTYPADAQCVLLVRAEPSGGASEWTIDLDRIRSQQEPDIALEPNDRVTVPYKTGRKTVYGVYKFLEAVVRVSVGGAATIF